MPWRHVPPPHQAFVHAESAVVSAVGFVGIMVVLNLVANVSCS